jgi:hypothetical protein
MTRGSITGQVKALSMIVAMQNFIPDRLTVSRLAASSEKKSPPAPAQIYAAACPPRPSRPAVEPAVGRRGQEATTIDPQPSPAPAQKEVGPTRPGVPGGAQEPEHAPGSAGEAPPDPGPSQSTFANRLTLSEAPEPYVSRFASVPDTRVPFSIKKNPFARPR